MYLTAVGVHRRTTHLTRFSLRIRGQKRLLRVRLQDSLHEDYFIEGLSLEALKTS
jgi:hypothetical protein